MNGDAFQQGSSVPLASSNVGQSGLRHGLNTNISFRAVWGELGCIEL